jgi:hypothetical protein
MSVNTKLTQSEASQSYFNNLVIITNNKKKKMNFFSLILFFDVKVLTFGSVKQKI